MGRVRLNAFAAANALVFGGGLAVAVGVYLLWGLGFAVLVAGVGAVCAGLFFVDVDAKRRPARG